MKALIAILIVAVTLYLANLLVKRYQAAEKNAESSSQKAPGQSSVAASALTGMPLALESALAAAQKQGAPGLRNFLEMYGRSVRDPRLADIELDYVVLLSRQDPGEAKRVFDIVKARTLTSSPVHERIQRLEKSFQ